MEVTIFSSRRLLDASVMNSPSSEVDTPFVGDALGLKPIMRIFDHVITTEDKVRGEKMIIPTIVKKTAAEIEPQTPYCIVYGNDTSVCDDLAKAMYQKMGYPPAGFYQIGAAIAVNAGPKVVGVIFKKKR